VQIQQLATIVTTKMSKVRSSLNCRMKTVENLDKLFTKNHIILTDED